MKCEYCQRPVKLVALERRKLRRKFLPYCRACRRYTLTWAHKVALAVLAVAAFGVLLSLPGVI